MHPSSMLSILFALANRTGTSEYRQNQDVDVRVDNAPENVAILYEVVSSGRLPRTHGNWRSDVGFKPLIGAPCRTWSGTRADNADSPAIRFSQVQEGGWVAAYNVVAGKAP